MNRTDYPALYQAADEASRLAQTRHLRVVKGELAVLICGAALAMFGIRSKGAAVLAALFFFIGVFLSLLVLLKGYEGVWYRCRAVAESVKTATWRFMMKAEPFGASLSPQDSEGQFRALLRKVLEGHTDLAIHLSGEVLAREAITDHMKKVRGSSIQERIAIYTRDRIDEQRRWYAGKADSNAKASHQWQVVLIATQVLAAICVLFRIAYPEFSYWPVEVLAVFAASALTWMQVRRFRELSAAYGLAAHEIAVLGGGAQDLVRDDQLSDFVGDAENAFSREHTQWVARKDVRG